jgi:pilus assembly protein CpaB
VSLRFRLVFAGSCAVLVLLAFVAYGNSVRAEAEKVRSEAIARYGGEVVSLVVTNSALEPGDVVGEKDVSVRDWVSDLAPQGAITSLDDVIGREVTVPVGKNAPVTKLAFRDSAHLADVPSGHVAVSVPVTDKLGVSRGVPQGSRLLAYKVSDEGSTLVCDDIVVLSAPAKASSIGSSAQLTLAVASKQVAAVLDASGKGDLRLVMPADDVDAPAGDAATPPSSEDSSGSDGGKSQGNQSDSSSG